MDRNAMVHADTVETTSIAITQMGHALADVNLVISETCAKKVNRQSVFHLDIYTIKTNQKSTYTFIL